MASSSSEDSALECVFATLQQADPHGERIGRVIRHSFDLLYNGQHTGRYSPSQLFKTEKTHCGSIVEIELRRALGGVISDGKRLDYSIAGHEVDCKFSFKHGGWMLPPECFGELLLVITADDESSRWSAGIVRASREHRRDSENRDHKTGLNLLGRSSIRWLAYDAELPPNILLQMSDQDRQAIFGARSGQQRLNELFRRAELVVIGRNAVATVAQQLDYMKRARSNGGSRSALRPEGYLIACGDYASHRQVALDLGAPEIGPGEFVSMRVVPCAPGTPNSVKLEGRYWRIAERAERVNEPAPLLPNV